jgi:hypothetical protein
VRFVAIAALAATFWLSVATLHLMIHDPGPRPGQRQMTPQPDRPSKVLPGRSRRCGVRLRSDHG